MKGERRSWVAYLLWLTIFGHRWYLGRVYPVYVLTLGYFGIVWFVDLFRIPDMVREYNCRVYQRVLAGGLAGGRLDARHSGSVPPCPGQQPGLEGGAHGRSALTSVKEAQGVVEGAASGSVEGVPAQPDTRPGGANPSPPPVPGEGGRQAAGPHHNGVSPVATPPSPSRRKRTAFILGLAVIGLIVIIAALSGRGSGGGKEGQSPKAAETVTVKTPLRLTITTPAQQTVDTPAFALEGITEEGAFDTVRGALNSPVSVQADEEGRFRAEVTLFEGSNYLTVTCEKEGRNAERSLGVTYRINPEQYKAQCQHVEFRMLDKNPDALKGQKYYAMGEVAQILEGALGTDIRLNVTKNKYGYREETIYVVYEGTVPAFEESVIKVWEKYRTRTPIPPPLDGT